MLCPLSSSPDFLVRFKPRVRVFRVLAVSGRVTRVSVRVRVRASVRVRVRVRVSFSG